MQPVPKDLTAKVYVFWQRGCKVSKSFNLHKSLVLIGLSLFSLNFDQKNRQVALFFE